ncbi:leukotriene B4 receptor 1-like [Rhinoraja longicauda]
MLANVSGVWNGSVGVSLPAERALACAVLGLASLLGIPGNMVVMWTIVVRIKQRSPTIVLMLALALADFVVLITVPLWIYALVDSWVFGLAFWRLTTYLIIASMYMSVFLIVAMGVERLLAVLRPFSLQTWRKPATVRITLVCMLALSLLLALPNALLHVQLDAQGRPHHRVYSSGHQEVVLLLLETLVGFLVPFSTLAISYAAISNRLRQMTGASRGRAVKLVASIVVAFVLCWAPHHAVNLIRVASLLARSSSLGTWHKVYLVSKNAAGAFAFISSCVNPILYAFAARNFSTGFRASNLAKVFDQMSSSIRERRDRESNDNEHRSESVGMLKL